MKEKKQFTIPRNYDKKFEFIPYISGFQHLVFVPMAAISYYLFRYTPFDASDKIVVTIILFGLPYFLIASHPQRENVSLYKHLYWRIKFVSRQRVFHYKKEGYVNVVSKEKSNRAEIKQGKETGKGSAEINPRLNTNQGHRARVTYNSRSEDGSVSKSVGN